MNSSSSRVSVHPHWRSSAGSIGEYLSSPERHDHDWPCHGSPTSWHVISSVYAIVKTCATKNLTLGISKKKMKRFGLTVLVNPVGSSFLALSQ